MMQSLSKNKLPDVIALQEPYDRAKLPGYVTHSPPSDRTGRDIKMIVEEQTCNRKVRIVEWDNFRKKRDREKKEGAIQDIGAWCKKILADAEKATKEIEWTDWREKEAQGGEGAEAPRPNESGQPSGAPRPSQKSRCNEEQDRLQRAFREVEGHLEGTGLVCAPDKSEILLHRPRKPGRLPKHVAAARQTGVRVTTKEGGRIPTVSKIRVLGLWVEENGANSELVTRLQKKVAAATNLIRKRKDTQNHDDNDYLVRLFLASRSVPLVLGVVSMT
ncbi:hypothetical protein MTO96_042902, partial [Rhipicephalus appendiculatus]